MRLYGHRPPPAPEKTKSSPNTHRSPMVFHLNRDFEEHELLNMGKYDRIYPSDDKKMQDLYNIFLAGSESAFRHSFDMKVKDTIAKVREDRKQEQMAKEEEEKRKVRQSQETRKRAQKSARAAALAALCASAKGYNLSNMTKDVPLSDRRYKEVDSTRCHINSPKSLKEEARRFERWSPDRSERRSRESPFALLTQNNQPCLKILKEDIVNREEMTVLEKVEKWKQGGCFGAAHRDILLDLSQREANAAVLDAKMAEEAAEWVGKRDGGVLQMLGKGEERMLESVAQQQEQTRRKARNDASQKGVAEKGSSLPSRSRKRVRIGVWKKDGTLLGISGRQSVTHLRNARQG